MQRHNFSYIPVVNAELEAIQIMCPTFINKQSSEIEPLPLAPEAPLCGLDMSDGRKQMKLNGKSPSKCDE